MKIINLGNIRRSRIPSSPPLLLEELDGNALLAVSIRKIRSTATECVDIIRVSDDVKETFGFNSSGILDFSAISSFLGASEGKVSKWYDQSGNGRFLKADTSLQQPEIQNTWTGGLPTIRWFTAESIMFTESGFTFNAFAQSLVANHKDYASVGIRVFVHKRPSGSLSENFIFSNSSVSYNIIWDQGQTGGGGRRNTGFRPNDDTNYRYLFNRPLNGTNRELFVNGTLEDSTQFNTNKVNTSILYLGNDPLTNSTIRGINSQISEFIVFDDALSTVDRGILETSQSSFFG